MKRCLLLLLLLLLLATAPLAAQTLTAAQAWIRAAPPGATMLAGYVRLQNDGTDPLRIVDARSDAFGSIEIHVSSQQDGVARMRRMPELLIAPGQAVELAPGGMHLMLMQPARKLLLGDLIVIDLIDADGNGLPIGFKVTSVPPGDGHPHHDGHPH